MSYGYTDGAGNVGTGVSRTVNVVDTTAPGVSLVGGSPVSVVIGGNYSELGATWIDSVDGTGFTSTPFSGSVNTGAL